jgi:Zn-dependent protease
MHVLSKLHRSALQRNTFNFYLQPLIISSSSSSLKRSIRSANNYGHVIINTSTFIRRELLPSLSTCHFSSGRPNNKQKIPPFNKLKPPKFSLGAGAAAVSGLTFLSKSKGILGALKLTKFATLGSMLLTVGTYTTFYGFPYAAGMVGLILTHEAGHALMMRQLKIPFSPIVFIPFLGAAIAPKSPPKNAYDDALIALGGPMLGTAGAFAVWGGGFALDSQLCFALADFGFMINLFNLIPVGMLDGGRIGNALSPYAGVAGVGVAGSMIGLGLVSNPIFYLITLGGGYQTGMRLWNNYQGVVDTSLPRNFYMISNSERMKIAGGYFGLIGLLFTTMAMNEHYKKSPERLIYEQKSARRDVSGSGLSNPYRDN